MGGHMLQYRYREGAKERENLDNTTPQVDEGIEGNPGIPDENQGNPGIPPTRNCTHEI